MIPIQFFLIASTKDSIQPPERTKGSVEHIASTNSALSLCPVNTCNIVAYNLYAFKFSSKINRQGTFSIILKNLVRQKVEGSKKKEDKMSRI